MKRESERGKLIKYHTINLIPISRISEALGSKHRGTGIYALYKGKKLVYVGLSKRSLRGRLKRHTKDRLKGKWNYYKWWQIRKTKYIKDIESLFQQISKPKFNIKKGKFQRKHRLK